MKNSAWYAFANAATSISRNRAFAARSALFTAIRIGTFPTTSSTPSIQSSRLSSVRRRVRSATARMPFAPYKYASFNSSRNPFSPMMSQIIMSMSIRRSYSGRRMRASFFVTCVPIVVRYSSSNMLIVCRRLNEVFPTALSPTRQTFDFSCFCFVIPTSSLGTTARFRRCLLNDSRAVLRVDSRRDRETLPLEDQGPEATEEDLHVLARLRRGVEVWRLERPYGLLDLLVAVQDHDFVFQVDLVDRVDDRNLADDVEDALDPVVELFERRVSREVAHCDDPFRAVEERLLEEIPEALLPHDVPDGHVHVDPRAVPGLERHLALRDLRAEGRDVAAVELVLDEPPDQGRPANGGLADETDPRLDALGFGHRGRRRIRLGLLKGSATSRLRKEAFSPSSS